MNERYQRVLEYPKILNRLAGLRGCPGGPCPSLFPCRPRFRRFFLRGAPAGCLDGRIAPAGAILVCL